MPFDMHDFSNHMQLTPCTLLDVHTHTHARTHARTLLHMADLPVTLELFRLPDAYAHSLLAGTRCSAN